MMSRDGGEGALGRGRLGRTRDQQEAALRKSAATAVRIAGTDLARAVSDVTWAGTRADTSG